MIELLTFTEKDLPVRITGKDGEKYKVKKTVPSHIDLVMPNGKTYSFSSLQGLKNWISEKL